MKKRSTGLIIWGSFMIFIGVVALIIGIQYSITWNINKKNYNLQYAFQQEEKLYYTKDEETIHVKELTDFDKKEVTVTLSENEAALLYCEKDNPEKCIWVNHDDITYLWCEHPIIGITISFFILAIGCYMTFNKMFLNNLFLSISMLIGGLCCIIYQSILINDYMNIKNDNNTIESKVIAKVHGSSDSKKIKLISTYTVDNKEYLYISPTFENGKIENELGKTIKLYYDKNNPEKSINQKNPISFGYIIFGSILIIIGFPLIFFTLRGDKNGKKQTNN